jgi:hypothetical protein
MDGLTNTVPLSGNGQAYDGQLSLFNEDEGKEPIFCKIKDWRSKKIVVFASLIRRNNG